MLGGRFIFAYPMELLPKGGNVLTYMTGIMVLVSGVLINFGGSRKRGVKQ